MPILRPGIFVADEAMADNVAFTLTWKAFEYVMKNESHQTLPDIYGLNDKQLFMISTAYAGCYADTYAGLNPFADHPEFYERINKGFANLPAFAETWNCLYSEPMIAKPVCSI